MFYNAKNGSVPIAGTEMDYVCFGRGAEALVILPGLSDGLRTVGGTSVSKALSHRAYARKYRVYMLSRRNILPEGFTTRDMAADVAYALHHLGIDHANVLGISQGGMIAQFLAIDHPELVKKLVLAVSLCRPNDTVCTTIPRRIAWAKAGDYRSIVLDTIETSSSPSRLRFYRLAYPVLGRTGKPKSFDRFLIHAKACITHDASAELARIACPTLVIGGDSDRNVGFDTSEELAEHIPGSLLHIYPGLGHAAFLEARDFRDRVLEFLSASCLQTFTCS